jgi:hypothetical protein
MVSSGDEYPWRGQQGANTKVTMWAEVNGKVLGQAVGQFDVTPRTGTEWNPIDNWPIAPPAPIPALGPPQIAAAYPSLKRTSEGAVNYGWDEGGPGMTHFAFATPTADYIARGPNRGIAYYTTGVRLKSPVVINVAASLFYTDKFYLSQRGGVSPEGNNYCTTDDMGSLHLQVFQHEKGHFRDSRAIMTTADVQAVAESVIGVIALDENDKPTVGTSEMTSLERFAQEQSWTIIDDPMGVADAQTHSDPKYKTVRPECFMRFPGDPQ